MVIYYSFLYLALLITPDIFSKSNIVRFLYVSNTLSSIELDPCVRAKLITVKVKKDKNWGSGFILKKEGIKYTVVTNAHVLQKSETKYTVETHDKKDHSAIVLGRFDQDKRKGDDVAILQFYSFNNYSIANLESIKKDQKVLASGFPLESSPYRPLGFFCTELASVSFDLGKPMEEGYQLGYFLSLPNGMSGGPLLNSQGKVVGINGKGDPAIFVNPNLYRYKDGLLVDESLDLLSTSSWAIPSKTIINLTSKLINLNNASSSSKPIVQNRELVSLEDKLRKSTVIISDNNPSNSQLSVNSLSSGVIFAKEGQKYYVLSINNQVNKQSKYGIFDSNLQEKYPAIIIKTYPSLGLSILRFTSDNEYNVTNLDRLKSPQANLNVKLAGWSGVHTNSFHVIDGKINNIQSVIIDRKFSRSDKINQVMLGSGIFSTTGNLVGIYTKLNQENETLHFIPMYLIFKITPWNIHQILLKQDGNHVLNVKQIKSK